MSKFFYPRSVESIQEDIARNDAQMAERNRRIDAYEVESTDCALSIWANDCTRNKLQTELELAKAGGKWTFDWLYDIATGQPVAEMFVVDTQYGPRQAVKRIAGGQATFMPCYHAATMSAKQKKNLAAKGFEFRSREMPAKVKAIYGSYIGATAHHVIVPA